MLNILSFRCTTKVRVRLQGHFKLRLFKKKKKSPSGLLPAFLLRPLSLTDFRSSCIFGRVRKYLSTLRRVLTIFVESLAPGFQPVGSLLSREA